MTEFNDEVGVPFWHLDVNQSYMDDETYNINAIKNFPIAFFERLMQIGV